MAAHEKGRDSMDTGEDVIVIKKYANRRLYNTATSSYVTLDYLAEMVRQNQDFVVYDAKSGDDITRSVLTQIILDEETKGQSLLPVKFLRQLIGYYGDNLQSFVPSYLEMSMESFHKNQESIRQSLSEAFSDTPGFKIFEDAARQNMAMFEQSMKMFGLNSRGGFPSPWPGTSKPARATDPALQEAIAEIQRLKEEVSRLEEQIGSKEKS